jgi:ubiquinone/menaquinone biosynthesis C-methylase UbiE
MPTFLHVGCGPARKAQTTATFAGDDWVEIRLDVDPAVKPDIVGTMTDMSGVPDEAVDAIFSSHNIEHLYPFEVPVALKEFRRVLRPDGYLVITCPDLQSVCALVAQDRLLEPAYKSSAGPISPIDIMYGHRPALAAGNLFMAHRCGFTQRVLRQVLLESGFGAVADMRRERFFDLWAVAAKTRRPEAEVSAIARQHFPTAV